MTLTKQDYDILSKPFEANEHEWRKGGGGTMLCYVTEEVITPRLTEVDPAFGLTEPIVIEDIDMNISVKIGITLKGVTRWGIGTATRDSNTKEPTKSAVTDAYTRAARMFGIGLYLKGLKGVTWVNNEDTLAEWLANGMQSERGKSGSQSTGGKVTQFPQAGQSQANPQKGFTEPTNLIATKMSNGKTPKPFMVIEGVTVWSREPFRKLKFSEATIESLANVGMTKLETPIIVSWELDEKGYKVPMSIKRTDSPVVVDANGKVLDYAS